LAQQGSPVSHQLSGIPDLTTTLKPELLDFELDLEALGIDIDDD
jgi:hypothetical protein